MRKHIEETACVKSTYVRREKERQNEMEQDRTRNRDSRAKEIRSSKLVKIEPV